MSNVISLEDRRRSKYNNIATVSLPPEIRIVKRMAVSPYSPVILLDTDNGVYEWDI
jgi:hypothetical protein